jgi:hypothetical protein
MKRNPQREFVAAFEKELRRCRIPDDRTTKRIFHALATGKKPKIPNAETFGYLALIGQGLRESAKKRKFKDEAELDAALEEMRGLGYKLRPAVAKALEVYKSALPRKGGPGRNPKLGEQDKRAIRGVIGTYIANGMTVDDAVTQCARERHVGKRTIWRAWQARGQN